MTRNFTEARKVGEYLQKCFGWNIFEEEYEKKICSCGKPVFTKFCGNCGQKNKPARQDALKEIANAIAFAKLAKNREEAFVNYLEKESGWKINGFGNPIRNCLCGSEVTGFYCQNCGRTNKFVGPSALDEVKAALQYGLEIGND